MKRVLKYVWKDYKVSCIVVFLCIVLAALTNLKGLTFISHR